MRLVLAMPTGVQVGYDSYFSTSPLGIESLAAHARQHANVCLTDLRFFGHDVQHHADMLLAGQPDMVGLSLNSAPHTKHTLALAKTLRQRQANLQIIVGGQHATFLTREMLADGSINAVIRGEGERTLVEIITTGQYAGVPGVSWIHNGKITHEPDRPLIANLDELINPARELLPDRRHYKVGSYRVEGIETSRGCPYQCSFCSIRNFHRGLWRPKTVEKTMCEIDQITASYSGPMVIYFADDNFATDIDRVVKICKAIAQRNLDTYFWCQARVDLLAKNPHVVEWMGKAKFAAVLTGIETPVPRLLKAARKGTSVQQITDAISLLHKHDIGVWGTFTLALPGETHEETAQTAKYITQANVDVAQITVATPIPGSDLYDKAIKDNALLHTDWDRYDFTSPTMKDQPPAEMLDRLMHRAYLGVYLSRRFLLSPFHLNTNLGRLRATAFAIFRSWIWFLIKTRLLELLHFRRRPRPTHDNAHHIARVPRPTKAEKSIR